MFAVTVGQKSQPTYVCALRLGARRRIAAARVEEVPALAAAGRGGGGEVTRGRAPAAGGPGDGGAGQGQTDGAPEHRARISRRRYARRVKLEPGPQKLAHADEPEGERPPWHWSAIGAVAIFAAWLPLAPLAGWAARALAARAAPGATDTGGRLWLAANLLGPPLAAFLVAACAGGAVVGRFGGRAGTKEAAVAGTVAAATAWALGLASTERGLDAAALGLLAAILVAGALSATFGGRLGVARRPRRTCT